MRSVWPRSPYQPFFYLDFCYWLEFYHFGRWLYRFPKAYAVVGGLNAAVVGLLAANFYKPIWKQSMQRPLDISVGIIGFLALRYARLPIPWLVLIILPIQLILR